MNMKYGLCLLGAMALGFAMMAWLYGKEGAQRRSVAVFAPLAVCFGLAGARLYALLFSLLGACPAGPLFSLEPTLYAMGGAVLGVSGACWLAARLTGTSAGILADALAPASMLTIALARIGEMFASFGGAALPPNGPMLFPLSVRYADGTWHLAVFFLEAVFAMVGLAYALNMRTEKPGERFALTLVFWGMAQVLCESFREQTVNLGFIGVQQMQHIAAALVILGYYAKMYIAKPYRKKDAIVLLSWVTAIECVAAIVLMEYAISHWVLPAALDYVIMAMAACGVFASVRLMVRRATRNEDVPWKDR